MVRPRIIIHGGAGNISPDNLTQDSWRQHRAALLDVVSSANNLLVSEKADALGAVVHAVSLLESNPLFNAGKGAVFTRAGRVELEASVMVSTGKRKRGVAVSMLKHVKHPIQLASEILKKGEDEDNGGAQLHVHLSGDSAEQLARNYGLDMVDESFFWTKKRRQEHCHGLQSHEVRDVDVDKTPDGHRWPDDDPSWDGKSYLPQGTVGAVAMDSTGMIAVATSTGGITNKLPGRIGDTPTFGSGFWAEQWLDETPSAHLFSLLSRTSILADCLPRTSTYTKRRAVAMSGTGNGDSFLRLAAVRTAAAKARFEGSSLSEAVKWMAGPCGELQRSAGDRWEQTGEGEGGIIGIELRGEQGYIVADFNCGGMFRAWFDEQNTVHVKVFH